MLLFIRSKLAIEILLVNLPANNYLLKVNNRNTRKRCEIYSNWTIKAPDLLATEILLLNLEPVVYSLVLIQPSYPGWHLPVQS